MLVGHLPEKKPLGPSQATVKSEGLSNESNSSDANTLNFSKNATIDTFVSVLELPGRDRFWLKSPAGGLGGELRRVRGGHSGWPCGAIALRDGSALGDRLCFITAPARQWTCSLS